MSLQFVQLIGKLVKFRLMQVTEKRCNPSLVRNGHFFEEMLSFGSQADIVGATILRIVKPQDQTVLDEPIGQCGDVSTTYHQQSRQVLHLDPFRIAIELGHQVEARQGSLKVIAQLCTQPGFHEVIAGKQAYPHAQGSVVVVTGRGVGQSVRCWLAGGRSNAFGHRLCQSWLIQIGAGDRRDRRFMRYCNSAAIPELFMHERVGAYLVASSHSSQVNLIEGGHITRLSCIEAEDSSAATGTP